MFSKKIVGGLLFFLSPLTFAQTPAMCKSAYYDGIRDTILFSEYENGIAIPKKNFWVVIDVSKLTKAQMIATGLELKREGYVPVLIQIPDGYYIIVYASDDYNDAEGIAQSIPFAKAEVVQSNPKAKKIEFKTLCTQSIPIGIRGMENLVKELKRLAEENLDPIKASQVKKLLNQIEEIIGQQANPKVQTQKVLKFLFGGE